MDIKRVEYAHSRADVYDAWDRKVRSIACSGLVGYGRKGLVVKTGSFFEAIDVDTMRRQRMVGFEFEKKKWELHDDYLQVRC